jgi:hypothetical protein
MDLEALAASIELENVNEKKSVLIGNRHRKNFKRWHMDLESLAAPVDSENSTKQFQRWLVDSSAPTAVFD